MSLAASMGDPNVGQLQDVLVHPVDPEDVVDEGTDEELHDLFADGHPLRIIDGETRRMAADKLGWATLDATIVPEPPEDTVVAQLDANTERINMTEFETVRALYDHYQETEATLADIGDKTGYSQGYLSQVFSLMDAPDWLVEPWRHPEHPLETSHALAVNSLLSSDSLEQYTQAGGLSQEQAREEAVDDAKLMIDVQAKHDLQVGEFRNRVKRCRKETLDKLKDRRSLEEKRADGQSAAADTEVRDHTPAEVPQEPCMVCGDDADRKIALDVCREDYGMLSELKANGTHLVANAEASAVQGLGAVDGVEPASDEHGRLFAFLQDLPPNEAQAILEELQRAEQRAVEGDHA